jgi:hypothetical protein
MDAALQRLGELLPFGVALEQVGALSDGLKYIIQIVNEAFEG